MLALDRVWRRRRAAQPGNGHQQPSLGLALPRWESLVCHAQGAGRGGPGALSGQHRSASGRAGTLCRRRSSPAAAWGSLSSADSGRTCALPIRLRGPELYRAAEGKRWESLR